MALALQPLCTVRKTSRIVSRICRTRAGKNCAKRTPVMLPTRTVGSMTLERPYSMAVASLSGWRSLRVIRYRVTEPKRIVKPLIAIAYFVLTL